MFFRNCGRYGETTRWAVDGSVYTERLLASSQVTDTYLLHLAASNDALLATFDTRIVTTAVPSGAGILFAIP